MTFRDFGDFVLWLGYLEDGKSQAIEFPPFPEGFLGFLLCKEVNRDFCLTGST